MMRLWVLIGTTLILLLARGVYLQMKEEEINHLKRFIDRLEKEQATSKANMQEEMKLQVSWG